MGPNVTLVESGAAVADQMEPELILAPRVSDETLQSLRVKFFVTDESDQFRDLAQRILGENDFTSVHIVRRRKHSMESGQVDPGSWHQGG